MNRPILTADAMRAAEAAAIAAGTPASELMERAGAAAAEAIWRFAGPLPALILCGPGNNGGDGYVIARHLVERGSKVRVAALGESRTPDAGKARSAWTGPVETFADASPAPLLVDALFGTGLARPLDGLCARRLVDLGLAARVRVAIDLPSGIATDDGEILSPVPDFDLTVTFGALKPSHRLQPAARHMGRIVVADIGVAARSRLQEIARPRLGVPGPDDNKYSRGFVAVVGGRMPGAAALTASAALHGGAGFVKLFGTQTAHGVPRAVVQAGLDLKSLRDPRLSAIAIGPGLGLDGGSAAALDEAMGAPAPLVLDADALTLIARQGVFELAGPTAILTPHHGEFERLLPGARGSKVDRALLAASRFKAVLVYKGSDTVVAAPDGRAAIAGSFTPWLATAGTGDVLTGVIAAARSRGLEAFEAACAGVWLHNRAAELAGPGLTADDLAGRLAAALAECL
ncbi:MAG TPA: NAD(P)H-hydrate dehydratase [Allosphingosinicella sp.]